MPLRIDTCWPWDPWKGVREGGGVTDITYSPCEYSGANAMSFKGMDVVSIRDLSREQIEQVLELSQKMVPYARGDKITKALDGGS